MSKIVQLTTENVKRLKAVTIRPDGSLVIIGGDNEQGKSSVLDSIAMALGGKDQVPSVPIRRGAEKASTVVDLGDIIVKRTFTASGGSTLVIEDKDKKRFPSPQALLDSLTGRLTFDPLSFLTLKPREQLEALKQLVGLDFTADDQERQKNYDERTIVNREVDRAQTSLTVAANYPDVTEQIDVTAINAESEAVHKHNARVNEMRMDASKRESDMKAARVALLALDAHHKEIIEEIEALNRKLKNVEEESLEKQQRAADTTAAWQKAQANVDTFEVRDIKVVQEKLNAAFENNRKFAANTARKAQEKVLADKRAESEALTKAIEKIDAGKNEKLAAAKFPVEGLSFGAGEVLLGGLPFAQASDAQRMRVSVAMAASMNPKLRVVLVRNGSLLDEKNLALLAKLAEEHKLQVWIERVGTADPSAIIIEDGMVKGATPEPTKEPAKEKAPEFQDLIP